MLTVESIQLLNLRQDLVVDMIPFDEIMDIFDVTDDEVYRPLTMKGVEPSRFLQVSTAESGFNCGRIYRFKSISDSLKLELIKLAQESNLIEKGSRGKRARINFWQNQVRVVFESSPVQYVLALIIMAV